MATIEDPNLEEEKEETPGSPPPAGSSGSAPAVSSYTAPKKKPQGSGRFINLQRYIEANQPKGQTLGQKISGRIGEKAQNIQN